VKPITFLLIIALPVIALVIRNYDQIIGKVAARLFYVVFSLLVVVAVIFPNVTERVAHLLGIGRGADLIFYATTMSLITLAGITLVKFRGIELRITAIVRKMAIDEFLANDGREK
jgi:hypothetical protein